MAGPLANTPLLSPRESVCECPQNVVFYVVLGVTVALSIVNLAAGITFCVWRKRRTPPAGWSNEQPRHSVANLAPPRPNIYLDGPQKPHLDPVRVTVDVTERTDPMSTYTSALPKRRSGHALLAKFTGQQKRHSAPTVSSHRSTHSRSPAASAFAEAKEGTSPSSPLPQGSHNNPPTVLFPNPRKQSLLVSQNPLISRSKASLMPPPASQHMSQAHEGTSTRFQTLPHPVTRPTPLTLSEVSPQATDRRPSDATAMYASPLTPTAAPSALFTGENAARALSYVWPSTKLSDQGSPHLPRQPGGQISDGTYGRQELPLASAPANDPPTYEHIERGVPTGGHLPSKRWTEATFRLSPIPPSPTTSSHISYLTPPSPLRVSKRPPSSPHRISVEPESPGLPYDQYPSVPMSAHSFDPEWKWQSNSPRTAQASETISNAPSSSFTRDRPPSTLLSQQARRSSGPPMKRLFLAASVDRERPLPRVPAGPRART